MSTFWSFFSDTFWNGLSSAQQAASQVAQQATYAKQFYAQQANLAFQAGSGNNWLAASAWDALGGFVQFGTGGTPQSPGQALWSMFWSVPALGEGMAAKLASSIQTGLGFTSTISGTLSSVGSVTPMSFPDWLAGMTGQLGGAMGLRGDAYSSLGTSLFDQIGTQVGAKDASLFATAAQQLSTIGRIFHTAANSLSIGGFLYGNKDALSALPLQVGGVLFDQCDTVLTGIDEIVGAYWDEKSQSIILVGKPDAGGNRLPLPIPALDGDHLKVALRAAIAGQPLGVSIDPPANYRYGENSTEMLPDGSPLVVSYLGDTAGTLYGAIMFESDRIMKCLSVGMENRIREPFAASVPGYRDLFGASKNFSTGPTRSWHRFWFVIDHVRLLKSPHDEAVVVDDVRIKVLTELELQHSPQGETVDLDDRAFAEHLTNNYDAYAREFPVFARLRELAKISAIARFLVAQRVSLDIGLLFQELPARVATPETTPSILRTAPTNNHTRYMSGGVDMDRDPEVLADSEGKAQGLFRAASAARKSSSAVWSVPAAGKVLQARSIPLAASSTFRRIVTDHRFENPRGAPLEFKRIYDSSPSRGGDFGPGWDVFLPYSMIGIRRRGKKAEVLSEEEKESTTALPSVLILRDTATGVAQLYRPTTLTDTSPTVYARVKSQTVTAESVRFEYDAKDTVTLKESRFHLLRQDTDHVFDLDGHLIELRAGGRCLLQLTYDNDRLIRMESDAGQVYQLTRSAERSRAITRVKASGAGSEHAVTFEYDETGRLKQAGGGSLAKQRYCYGLSGQLAEVRDSMRHTCEIVPQGNSSVTDDVVQLPFGSSLRRKWADGHLISIDDDLGCRADIIYSGDALKQITIRGRDCAIRKFEFDTDGYLRIANGAGRETALETGSRVGSGLDLVSAVPFKEKARFERSRNRNNPLVITKHSSNELAVHFV